MRIAWLTAVLLLVGSEMHARAVPQPSSARVFVPPAVLIMVPDSFVETIATSPVTISFDSAVLMPGRALRIRVRADSDLTIVGGPAIPASNLSWTTSNVANGVGIDGILQRNSYTTVYEGNAGATTGSVDLTWRLAPVGGSVLAGTHQATLRWRFEVFRP